MSMKPEDMVKTVIKAGTEIKVDLGIDEEEAPPPIVITSSNETKEPDMSLRHALQTLMKYAKLLEDQHKQRMEEDAVSDKTGD